MNTLLGVSIGSHVLNVLIIIVGLLMMGIILIQRGKGGGLAGAFGGGGGSSAFGSKSGDAFTKITLVMALVWVSLIMGQVIVIKRVESGGQSNDISITN